MPSKRRLSVAALAAVLLAARASQGGPETRTVGILDPVRVSYPIAACASGAFDVELWSRDAGAWEPHPLHPRVAVGSCQLEDAGYLLNELRMRCSDAAPDEGWRVGVSVFQRGVIDACALPGAADGGGARAPMAPRKRVVIEPEAP